LVFGLKICLTYRLLLGKDEVYHRNLGKHRTLNKIRKIKKTLMGLIGRVAYQVYFNYLRTVLDKYRIIKYKPVFKQDYLFIEALKEAGIPHKGIMIDHENAYCCNGKNRYNLIFPLRLINITKELEKEKQYKYCFIGLLTPQRRWVEEIKAEGNLIKFTNNGRIINKAHIDKSYYESLAKSQFVLCPRGDFLWSYRFFEAIICHSIPIVESNGVHSPTMEGFKFFFDADLQLNKELEYDPEVCRFNYNLFLERHVLIKK
jgi:hypothetical protein